MSTSQDSEKSTAKRRQAGFVDPVTMRIVAACDAIGELIEYWGFKKAQGRIWAFLVLSANPRHQIEIAEALGVSKSLVSLTVSELSDRHLVRPIDDRRNAPLEATLDVWPIVSDVLRSREWMLLESARIALEDARDELSWSEETPEYDTENVSRVLNMIEVVQSLLNVVMSLRKPEPPTEEAGWMKKAASLIRELRLRRAK